MKIIKNIFISTILLILWFIVVYAVAPNWWYSPNQTLDPECAPWEANCFVKIIESNIGKFIDWSDSKNAVYNTWSVWIWTSNPDWKLNVVRNESSVTNGINIHWIRTDLTVSGASLFSDDVNGYWANVISDWWVSVNGVFVHATQNGNNNILNPVNMTLVSGTYGEAQIKNPSSAYNAVGAAGSSESTQSGSNTWVNGLARNANKINIGVNAIANLNDLEIATDMWLKLISGFSAGLSSNNSASWSYDFSIYSKWAKNYFEWNVWIWNQNPNSKLSVKGLLVYENNSQAKAWGLNSWDFYRTSSWVLMVVFD